MGQKELGRLGNSIYFGQTWARNSHQDSAVQFVTTKGGPEAGTKTRQYDLLRPNVGQKEPPRFGSTICYDQTWARKSHRDSAVRFVTANVGQKEPSRLGSTISYGQTWARKSYRDSAIRYVSAKRGPERATESRYFVIFRPNVGQKEPSRFGSTICYDQTWARRSHRDSAIRFIMAKYRIKRLFETRQYDLIRPNKGQKELPRFDNQELTRNRHRDSAIRFIAAKRGPERAIETRQCNFLQLRVGHK